MKQFLVFILSFTLFVSCKKNQDETTIQTLAAQNIFDVPYGTDPAQKMDIYLPAGRSKDSTRLIVMVHGGAWSTGDKSEFNQFVPVLQQRLKGYAIANINYRLAHPTGNHFPTQEQDMNAAVDFLLQKNVLYHYSENFVLLGASSGGHQATLQAYKYDQPKIKAVIDFFAPVDMKAMYNDAVPGSLNQIAIKVLVGGTPTTNPGAYEQSSPINFVSAMSPPTIIFHGGMDDIVNISQSVALKNKLNSLGVAHQLVVYPGEGHNIWPPSIMNDAFDKIESFVKAHVR